MMAVLIACLTIPQAALAQAPAEPVAFNTWPTYGFDAQRTGFNPNTALFTPRRVPALHLAWTADLGDYNTQTQPILIMHYGRYRGILIAGGASGKLQGFDAFTGERLWARALGQQLISCGGGASFGIGIAGTAAYDPATHAAYVADSSSRAVNGPSSVTVHRFDPATGKDTAPPVEIAPHPLYGEVNTGHTSITIGTDGELYAGTGSSCDISSWRGRVAVVDLKTMSLRHTFFTVYGRGGPFSGGGVWGWGGVSLDAAGHVFFGVGNADDSGLDRRPFVNAPTEYAGLAEHVVETTPWLDGLIAANYPAVSYHGASVDLDLTGTPVLGTPIGCPTIAALQGKAGALFFYDAAAIRSGPIAAFQLSASTYQAAYIGNPAYSPVTELMYAAVATSLGGSMEAPGLIAFDVSHCTPVVAWHSVFGADSFALPDTPPRSAPTVTAGGIVFLGTPSATGGELWALDATTGEVLNGGGPILETASEIRMAPVVSGNRLWLLDNDGDLYGMTLDPNIPAVANPHRSRTRTFRPHFR